MSLRQQCVEDHQEVQVNATKIDLVHNLYAYHLLDSSASRL
jgi:hypothetical protein